MRWTKHSYGYCLKFSCAQYFLMDVDKKPALRTQLSIICLTNDIVKPHIFVKENILFHKESEPGPIVTSPCSALKIAKNLPRAVAPLRFYKKSNLLRFCEYTFFELPLCYNLKIVRRDVGRRSTIGLHVCVLKHEWHKEYAIVRYISLLLRCKCSLINLTFMKTCFLLWLDMYDLIQDSTHFPYPTLLWEI